MRTRIVIWTIALALALCAPGAAWAKGDTEPRNGRAGLFKEADANEDGKVTLEELKAVSPEASADRFSRIDANGDGALTPEEIRAGGPRGRWPGAQRRGRLAELLRKADANGDEKVSLEELQAAAPKMTADKFKHLDRDGNGFITKSDIPVGGRGPRGPMRELARKADTDGNRQITFDELIAVAPEFKRERFDAMDRSGDGVLSPADHPGPGGLGQRPRGGRGELLKKLREADADADGKITYEEAKTAKPDLPKEVFDRIDRNGDGVISKEDARPKDGKGRAKGDVL